MSKEKKIPVEITKKAAEKIKELTKKDKKFALKVGVKKGGCAGMEYTLEFVDKLYGHEEIIEKDGAKLVIDPMAQMFLFGSEIDYEVSLLESGFKFRNPNVTETCGCGESIKFS